MEVRPGQSEMQIKKKDCSSRNEIHEERNGEILKNLKVERI
jgi:hypothetical protein